MKQTKITNLGRMLLIILFNTLILITFHQKSQGQEKPPRPIQVTVQNAGDLHFGAFCTGASGGTVTIYPDGSRGYFGVILLSVTVASFSPAIFLVSGIKGTVISITDNSTFEFRLNNGSYYLKLHLGPPQSNTSCGTPFVLNAEYPATMEVRVGGILTVGDATANPPGNYSGTFDVIFNQE